MAQHGGEGLRLRPLRGLRYRRELVGDLARVLCPPYDMVHPAGRARLLRSHPRNLVRLTLPTAGSPQQAAELLAAWQGEGVLARDAEPALYVMQVAVGSRVTRGVVATVGLDGDGRALMPHEDVDAAAVEERRALLAATGCDLEPVMLAVRGGIGRVADEVALGGRPLVTAGAGGQSLALWRADPGRWQPVVDAAVKGRRALVADGHHRLAAALTHRAQRRRQDGPGPWDALLALVVDPDRHPLLLSAIHRSVPGVTAGELRRACAELQWREVGAAAGVVPLPPRPGVLVVGDGSRWWEAGGVTGLAGDGGGHSARWHRLDSAVLHEALLARTGAGRGIGHHHDPWSAVHAAREQGGCAILLHAPALADVTALAAEGELMPRKSTSFGPKPPSGLLLRRHADDG